MSKWKSIFVFLLGTVLLCCFDVIFYITNYSFLFTANFVDLQVYYPNWFGIVYGALRTIELFYFIVVAMQLYILLHCLFGTSYFRWLAMILAIGGVYYWKVSLSIFSITMFLLYVIAVLTNWRGYIFLYQRRFLSLRKSKLIQPKVKSITRREKWQLFFFVLFAFALRIIWILFTDNSGNGDAGMRLMGAQNWVLRCWVLHSIGIGIFESPVIYLFPSIDWLPLHYYLMYGAKLISGEWIYSSRILSAVFGALSLVPLYKLSLLKFNRTTALISVVILTFYVFHIYLSSLVLSGPFYIFFLLYSYYFLEKWLLTNNDRSLVYIALMLACLCLLRYEGWFFSVCCMACLPLLKKITKWRFYLYSLVIVLLSMVFVMLCEVSVGEHPLRGILHSDDEVRITLALSPMSFFEIAKVYSNSWIPMSFVSAIIFLIWYVKQYNFKQLLSYSLYVIPFFPFLYKLLNGTLTAQPRYMILYMVPLIPFVAYLFYLLFRVIGLKLFLFLFTLYLGFLNITFCKQLQSGYPILKYPQGFNESARFFKNINECSVYIDAGEGSSDFNWIALNEFNPIITKSENYIRIKSKLGVLDKVDSVANLNKRHIISSVESDTDAWGVWNYSKFDSLLKNEMITHVAVFPNGKLNGYLKLSVDTGNFNGHTFVRLCNYDGYMIYEVMK